MFYLTNLGGKQMKDLLRGKEKIHRIMSNTRNEFNLFKDGVIARGLIVPVIVVPDKRLIVR